MNPAALAAAEVVALTTAARRAHAALNDIARGDIVSGFTDATIATAGFTAAAALAANQLKSFAAAASPNGMKGLSGAMDQLAGTVGTLLLPGFTMLGAAIYTAADAVSAELQGSFEELGAWYADNADSFVSFAEGLKNATLAVVEFGKGVGGKMDSLGGFLDWRSTASRHGTGYINASDDAGPGAMGGGVAGAAAKQPFNWAGGFLKNMEAIVTDMQHSQGQTGFSRIEDVFKTMQKNALQSQLEAKKTQMQEQAMQILRRILTEIERRQGVIS